MPHLYAVWTQREGHAPRQLHTFTTQLRAERARAAAEITLNEFASGRPWKVWVDVASTQDFLGDDHEPLHAQR